MLIPMEEQKEISEYLDAVIPKYDEMELSITKQIELLQEIRTRMISDIVTGQIDVRGIIVPEFEYVAESADPEESEEEETEIAEEEEV